MFLSTSSRGLSQRLCATPSSPPEVAPAKGGPDVSLPSFVPKQNEVEDDCYGLTTTELSLELELLSVVLLPGTATSYDKLMAENSRPCSLAFRRPGISNLRCWRTASSGRSRGGPFPIQPLPASGGCGMFQFPVKLNEDSFEVRRLLTVSSHLLVHA